MNKNIIEKIQEQFDFLPCKINNYLRNNFLTSYAMHSSKIQTPLAKFHVDSHNRWNHAMKEYNVKVLYALPKDIFNKIEYLNTEDFINVWNLVLKYIWNNIGDSQRRNNLFLMVRTHLIQDYGYFDSVDKKRLFKMEGYCE